MTDQVREAAKEWTHEHEMGPSYARELDAAAAILDKFGPLKGIKALGRRDVAAALRAMFPEDDAEPVTKEWLTANGFEMIETRCDFIITRKSIEVRFTPTHVSVYIGENREKPTALTWQHWMGDGFTHGQVRRLIAALQGE